MINYYRVKIKKSLRKPLNYMDLIRILNISHGLLNYHLRILKSNNEIKSIEGIKNNKKIIVYEKC